MANTTFDQIIKTIQDSQNILLSLHCSPDGDSIGSNLALYLYLKDIGKKVTLIKGDSELPQSFKNQPGFSEITAKNYFDLDLTQFDLFIILDSAALNQVSKLKDITFPKNLKTILIDHHPYNQGFCQTNLIDSETISTCQIIFELFKNWKIDIIPDIAVNLFVGLYTDSGGFKYQKTSSRTFEIASRLAAINPDFPKYIFEIENNSDPSQIYFKGIAFSSVELFFNQRVAISSVSYETLVKNDLSSRRIEKAEISNTLKSVIGWDIGISIVEHEPGICSVSMRTRNSETFDLYKIGEATGAGGGHPAASGATIKKPLPEAKKFLLDIIQKLHPELGEP
ncbi:MAG: bifunctional oligoribonuclease/PAP phosphatase NrnA [Candidatus Shapirobacteria bacterium]